MTGVAILPLISIITVNLNNEVGIKRTLDSLIHQKFQDFEWIVIDGGSTDNSVKIADSWKPINKRKVLVSEKDDGIYSAMNRGMQESQGQWLLFLNSGDSIATDKVLGNLHRILTTTNRNWVLGANRLTLGDKPFSIQHSFPFGLGSLAMGYRVIPHQASLFRSEKCKDSIRYLENVGTEADQEFIYNFARKHGEPEEFIEFITDFEINGKGSQNNPGHFVLFARKMRARSGNYLLNSSSLDFIATCVLFTRIKLRIQLNKFLTDLKIRGFYSSNSRLYSE
jgi:glycosyltransferase involved in cell wall biosynthesis